MKTTSIKTLTAAFLACAAISLSGCGPSGYEKESHAKAVAVLASAKSSTNYFADPVYNDRSGEHESYMLYMGGRYGNFQATHSAFLSSPKHSEGLTTEAEWAAAKALSDKREKLQLAVIADPASYIVNFGSTVDMIVRSGGQPLADMPRSARQDGYSVFPSLASKESVFSFRDDGHYQHYFDAAKGRVISLDKFCELQKLTVDIPALLQTPGVKVTARDGKVFFTPPQKDALRTNDGEISVSAEELEKNAPESYKKALGMVTK